MVSTDAPLYTVRFFVLCMSNVLFSASFNMMIPELPAYLSSLGGGEYKGLIIALFTITAGISRPFSGKLADTIGRVPVMIFGSVVCVVCSLCYPLLTFVGGFLLLRLVHGFSTGFKPTGTAAYVADIVPLRRRGEAMGMVGLSANIGMSAGPPIGSYLVQVASLNTMFYASSLLALLSVLILAGMKETLPEQQRFHPEMLRIRKDELIEWDVMPAAIVTALSYFCYGALLTVVPDFSEHVGIHNKGLFFTAFTLTSLGIRFVSGKLSDRLGREPVLKLSLMVMTVSLVLMSLATRGWHLLAASALYGVGLGMNSPTVTAWTIDLSKETQRGKGLATMYIALEIGIGSGALVSAWLYQNDFSRFSLTFGLTAVVTVLALLYLRFLYKKPGPAEY